MNSNGSDIQELFDRVGLNKLWENLIDTDKSLLKNNEHSIKTGDQNSEIRSDTHLGNKYSFHRNIGSMFNSWMWKTKSDQIQVGQCLDSVKKKQMELLNKSYSSIATLAYTKQQLVLIDGCYKALNKEKVQSNKLQLLRDSSALDKKFMESVDGQTDAKSPNHCLALVGSRAVLHFAFAFLKRAWRSGEDGDLCSDLLDETLAIFQCLPAATFFNETDALGVWTEVIKKSKSFFRIVAKDDLIGGNSSHITCIPIKDRQSALSLYLELSLLEGSLTSILDAVMFLLHLSTSCCLTPEQQKNRGINSSPLLSFLKRLSRAITDTHGGDDLSKRNAPDTMKNYNHLQVSKNFLKHMELPQNNTAMINLKDAAIISLCYLDSCASKYLWSTDSFFDVHKQEFVSNGDVSHLDSLGLQWLVYESLDDEVVVQMVCSKDCLLVLTNQGSLYTLSLVNKTSKFEEIPSDDKTFASISSHWEADHFLAVTSDGLAYSWGEGYSGQLGHGTDHMFVTAPMQIKHLSGKFVTKASCSSLYSAFITSCGELFICGGMSTKLLSDDITTPMLIRLPEKVVDVACQTADSCFVVCCSGGGVHSLVRKTQNMKTEVEYESRSTLTHIDVVKVVSAPKNLFAFISKSGRLHLWNPSDGSSQLMKNLSKTFSDNEEHFCLNFSEKVVDVSFTTSSIFVLLESGRVVGWSEDGKRSDEHFIDGMKYHQHHHQSSNIKPNLRFIGICCANNHIFAWTSGNPLMLPDRKEFLVDLSATTFEYLNQLLSLVFDSINSQPCLPPSQDEECLAVSTLDLLNLQLRFVQSSNPDFFSKNVDLASSLKQKIIWLSSSEGVLETIEKAARCTLRAGWRVLMPGHEERVASLSLLLGKHNNGYDEAKSWDAGGRFMIDLLVESLLVGGGLEESIDRIFSSKSNGFENNKEIMNLLSRQPNSKTKSDMINMTRSHESLKDAMNSILQQLCPSLVGLQPANCSNAQNEDRIELFDLIGLIFRNASLEVFERIKTHTRNCKTRGTDFTGIILKFQRLFFANLLDINGKDSIKFDSGSEILNASFHLKRYVDVVCQNFVDVFKFARNLQSRCQLFSSCCIIPESFIGSVLPEVVLSLLFLETKNPSIIHFADLNESLTSLLEELDFFNRLFPNTGHDNDDELMWEKLWVHDLKAMKEEGINPMTLRQSDLDNLLKEGRLWTRNNNKIYDLNKLNDLLGIDDDTCKKYIGRNSSEIFEPGLHSKEKLNRLPECIIGLTDENDPFTQSSSSSGERMSLEHSRKLLSLLLGIQARKRSNSTSISESEVKCSIWLRSSILTGGLICMKDVYSSEEDKDAQTSCLGSLSCQCRVFDDMSKCKDLHLCTHFNLSKLSKERESSSSSSQFSRERESLSSPRNEFGDSMNVSSNHDSEVQKSIDLISLHCNKHSSYLPIIFPLDHPLCEVTRFMVAVFMKHLNLLADGRKILENECNTNHHHHHRQLPDSFENICRVVCQTKKFLIKIHQDSGRSYKEICSTILERCRFLLVEVGPIRDQSENNSDRNVQSNKCRWVWATNKILENLGRRPVLINHQKALRRCDDVTNILKDQPLEDDDSSELKNLKDSANIHKESPLNLIHHSLKHLDPHVQSIVRDVMNFLLHCETVNLELLKQAILNQNVRASVRIVGLQNISSLLSNDKLDDSTLFYILLGWQGILLSDEKNNYLSCLSDVHLVSSSDKEILELEQQKLNGWFVDKLRDVMRGIESHLANDRYRGDKRHVERTKNVRHKQMDCLTETKRRSSMPIISGLHGNQEPSWSHDCCGNLGKCHGKKSKCEYDHHHHHHHHLRHGNEETGTMMEPSQKIRTGLLFPRSRFVPLLMSTLTAHHSLSSLNALINSGALALVKTCFRIFVNEDDLEDKNQQLYVEKDFQTLVDEFLDDREAIFSTFDGPKVAAAMKIGSRVVRGPNWNWGNQDGLQPGVGTLLTEIDEEGWVDVEWDSGASHTYRMGREGKYDLMLYEGSGLGTYLSKIKEEFHAYLYKKSLLSNSNESSNPLNSLFCIMASNLANTICLNVLLDDSECLHGCLDGCAASKLANHLKDIIDLTYLSPQDVVDDVPPRSLKLLFHGCCFDLNHWSGYGFVRSIASNACIAKRIVQFAWVENLLEFFHGKNVQLVQKLQILLLLESILPHFDSNDLDNATLIAKKLIRLLGSLSLECRYDQSMKNNDLFACRGRKLGDTFELTSASHTSTLAEQLRSLVASLFHSPHWMVVMTTEISEVLSHLILLSRKSLIEEAFGEASSDLSENILRIFGVLSFLGGVDENKLRLGGRVIHEEFGEGTISSINITGDVSVQFDDSVCEKSSYYKELTVKKLSMSKVIKDALNEKSLEQWSKFLYFTFCSSSNFKISEDSIKFGLESLGDPLRQREFIRNCQLQYFLLKASRIVFNNQEVYRKMLNANCIIVESPQTDDSPIGMEFRPSNSSSPIFRQILQLSTQPSPILPVFNSNDLELALISLFQTFNPGPSEKMVPTSAWCLREAIGKQLPNTSSSKNPYYFDSSSLNSGRPLEKKKKLMFSRDGGLVELIQQLVDMGFQMDKVQCALQQFGSQRSYDDSSPMIDSVVTWLLDNCSEDIHGGDDNDDGDDDDDACAFKDVGRCPAQAKENVNSHKIREFSRREEFASEDSYATYVKDGIEVGMCVRCCESYEDVQEGDVGIVQELDNDDLHDLNVKVDWMERGGAYWVGYIHLDLNGEKSPTNPERNVCLKFGDYVKIRDVTREPFYGWGLISRTSIGIISGLSLNGEEVTVNFTQQPRWNGLTSELERVLPPHMNPGDRGQFGIVSVNQDDETFFNKCSENRRLPSVTLRKQGIKSDSLKLKILKKKSVETREVMIHDWRKCIKNIEVSSRGDIAQSLFENVGGFWQSSGSIGKHWIRLEIHENVLIDHLSMTVNLSDSSYIPSVIVIMGGLLAHQCHKQLATIHASLIETEIPLLENLDQFYRFIEIQVRKCNNDGIDCRIPGLNVVGKLSFQDTPQVFSHLSYLASDSNPGECTDTRTLTKETKLMLNSKDIQHTYVFVWGLNDKDQLGGPRGSKIKVPILNEILSSLKCLQIAGGSKSLFCVTQDGKLYASGEATNGRLGLGVTSGHISVPRQLSSLSQYVIKKISVHSGGRHALALTVDGKVFSWGEGDDGKLGHFSRLSCDKPRLIEALRSKRVRDIACGSSHSAAIISNGDLYTWGLGEYGRLGHGDYATQEQPKLVVGLVGQRVIQASLGSRDAQTLALTDEGIVYSWGDGDFGKLGRGGSEGCNVPQVIEKLSDLGVCQVECGAQFSLALTKSGQVWTWGKGDYFRLGHGTDAHVRKPQLVEGLKDKKIVHVAVGALHCLAVSDAGKVYSWGDNDHGQQGNGATVVNKKPSLVHGLEKYKISKVSCGSSHSLAWCTSDVPYSFSHEPIAFSPCRDPLGTSLLEIETEEKCLTGYDVCYNYKPPSLSRIVLSLETRTDKLRAIAHLMRGLQISYARHAVMEALKPVNNSPFLGKSQTPMMESPLNEEVVSSPRGLLLSRSVHSEIEINEKMLKIEDHSKKHQDCGDDDDDDKIYSKAEGRSRLSSKSCSDLAGMKPYVESRCFVSEPILPCMTSLRPMTDTFKKVKSDGSDGVHNATSSNDNLYLLTSTTDSPKTGSQDGMNQGLDDFTKELSVDDSRMIVDLLKIATAGRLHCGSQSILSNLLNCLAKSNPLVSEMLLELCVTELEDVSHSTLSLNNLPPVVQESQHPYIDNSDMTGTVRIPGATSLRVEFDRQCSTERRHDHLSIMDANMRVISIRSGRELSNWSQELVVGGDELHWRFRSDGSVNGWGWRFTVHPTTSKFSGKDFSSDRNLISRPSIHLVMCLLDLSLSHSNNHNIILRLAAALATCSQIGFIAASHKIWILQKLRTLMMFHFGRNIDITHMLSSPSHELSGCPSLIQLVKHLPETLLRQFEYEDPIVRSGKQLMFSRFFKVLVGLACDLGLDSFQSISESQNHRWNWFHKFCQATRVATSLQERSEIPRSFCDEVTRKIREVSEEDETLNRMYESHEVFTLTHDQQLLQWLNRKPDDWVLTSESTGQIWVWGHNHRGQLGGVEGAKIKVPVACEGLSILRPVQIVGGEQTLFAVTVDGKVHASGYGAGGRLGIGGTESVSVLTLLESIQHIQIKKLSVNSGGKHCLAITSDGDVFSWGEGEDGKLGHGAKTCCDRPRVIETLRGKDVIDVAAGGAHSACISARGELYTWGKGRYGRLGHGDGEDQLKPKFVEYLRDYKVVDVACGSGDAQTLCLTSDDSVWSWGDGDYGKLGRGGSEGCKVPVKIESLQGLGVIKVECGSQFSVALTRAGSIYTWGKGDYHRLGHGTDDHVRKPKRIMSLQGKKVIGIACGSLHCVCCTDSGEVYTWGDNDEGQLGDGTMVAIQKPRIVSSLQGKKTNKLACGSAHSFAWSLNKPNYSSKLPQEIPMEFNLLQNIQPRIFRNRLILLHHFSDILCPFINMIDLDSLNSNQGVCTDMLRSVLASSAKESVFKKVVQATMVRDKPHGPVIEINRIQVKRSRNKGGLAGVDGIKSVFGQICSKMADISSDSLLLPHRVWKVKFIGESVDDCGGGYSESITEICDELQNGSVAILIQTPNGRDESGSNRDCFILNPSLNSSLHGNMFKFFGMLLGIAIRTGSPLNLNLAEPIWKQIVGQNLSITDLDEIDRDFVPGLMRIKDMDDDLLRISEMPFSTTSSSGMFVFLNGRCQKIDPNNKDDYVAQALSFRLQEFEVAVKYVREGMSQVVPVPLLHLFTGVELETMVCGSPDIPVNLLKSVATYKGVEPNTDLMHWFWEVMEEFTDVERSLFLRFVWGRTRLPRTIADFRGRDFVIQVLDRYEPPDSFLPESYTCFFLLKMPRYSSKKVLKEKLKYAIHFCKSIDTDDYARIALASPHLDTESSNDEDGVSCNGPSDGGTSTDED